MNKQKTILILSAATMAAQLNAEATAVISATQPTKQADQSTRNESIKDSCKLDLIDPLDIRAIGYSNVDGQEQYQVSLLDNSTIKTSRASDGKVSTRIEKPIIQVTESDDPNNFDALKKLYDQKSKEIDDQNRQVRDEFDRLHRNMEESFASMRRMFENVPHVHIGW